MAVLMSLYKHFKSEHLAFLKEIIDNEFLHKVWVETILDHLGSAMLQVERQTISVYITTTVHAYELQQAELLDAHGQ